MVLKKKSPGGIEPGSLVSWLPDALPLSYYAAFFNNKIWSNYLLGGSFGCNMEILKYLFIDVKIIFDNVAENVLVSRKPMRIPRFPTFFQRDFFPSEQFISQLVTYFFKDAVLEHSCSLIVLGRQLGQPGLDSRLLERLSSRKQTIRIQ